MALFVVVDLSLPPNLFVMKKAASDRDLRGKFQLVDADSGGPIKVDMPYQKPAIFSYV